MYMIVTYDKKEIKYKIMVLKNLKVKQKSGCRCINYIYFFPLMCNNNFEYVKIFVP